MQHPAYILSGGRSERFGSDKARYQTDKGPQLLVLADQLREAGHAVHIVADRADRYADLGCDCLVDVQPDSGPLAGLASALEHHLSSTIGSPRLDQWLLLVNCDQREWHSQWYDELLSLVDDSVEAVSYYANGWQPLPGLFHVDLLPTIIERLHQRQLSFRTLFDSLGLRVAKVHTHEPPSQWSFNTQSDLQRPSGPD